MKVAICEFHQETNSFNPRLSTREDYQVFGIWEGAELFRNRGQSTALEGMIWTLENNGAQVIPTYRMWANAAGPVEASVVEEFKSKTAIMLKETLPLDGVCISMHGATQSTQSDDVCGELLADIRKIVGEETAIAVSLDLHANVTQQMLKAADFLCGYHTYPHVDFYETGCRAARLCLKMICRKDEKATTTGIVIPLIVPASAYSTLEGDFSELMHYGDTLVENGSIFDYSIFQMQPWLDVAVGGSVILTVSKKGETGWAMELANRLWNIRNQLCVDLWDVNDIIRLAEQNDSGKPIVLADSADSTNAGSGGDSAFVLEQIVKSGSKVKAALYISDLKAAEKAFDVGVGNQAEFCLGAGINPFISKAVRVNAYVRSLHDGCYMQEGPSKRGLVNQLGSTAVLTVGNVDVIVTNYLLGPGDLQLFRHHGIEPSFYQMVAVKACTSFRVAYMPIAKQIIDADTPGAAAVNLLRLPYQKIPRDFFPFKDTGDVEMKMMTGR